MGLSFIYPIDELNMGFKANSFHFVTSWFLDHKSVNQLYILLKKYVPNLVHLIPAAMISVLFFWLFISLIIHGLMIAGGFDFCA